MELKILAMDFDGTLLNKQNAVTPENLQAIQQARAKGIEVVPCTGRLLCESHFAIDAIGGCNYSIHCNGSFVWDHRANRPVFMSCFDDAVAQDAIRRIEKYGVLYQVYVDDASCCPKRSYHEFNNVLFNDIYVKMFRDTQLWLEDVGAEIAARGLKCMKFYIPSRDHDLLEQIRQEMAVLPGFETTYSSHYSLEVFPSGMDKYNGLARLLEHLGLGFENLMMIGDSENDLRAIQAAKVGVAMQNGQDFVKEAADYVTIDCDHSGVAHAIRKFLLN